LQALAKERRSTAKEIETARRNVDRKAALADPDGTPVSVASPIVYVDDIAAKEVADLLSPSRGHGKVAFAHSGEGAPEFRIGLRHFLLASGRIRIGLGWVWGIVAASPARPRIGIAIGARLRLRI
jgi:hypothetical protein